MREFKDFYATACLHKGGESALEGMLPKALSAEALAAKSDAFYLSAISLRIFRAGLKHSMVDKKWPEFEKVFHGFEPLACAHISDDFIEDCMANKSLIRHMGKLKTIRENAMFVMDASEQSGGFGRYLAQWSSDDIVGLWNELKKRGAHLGGNSGAAFLRMVGKDTFLLTNDVVTVLKLEALVSKTPTSQKDLRAVQSAFNVWQSQSGRSLCEISRILSVTASS